jgi:hypothetical protein
LASGQRDRNVKDPDHSPQCTAEDHAARGSTSNSRTVIPCRNALADAEHYIYIGCFKKSLTTSKAYTYLSREHV